MDNEFGVLLITDQLLVRLYEITTSKLSIDFEEGWFTSANLRINASKEIMGAVNCWSSYLTMYQFLK